MTPFQIFDMTMLELLTKVASNSITREEEEVLVGTLNESWSRMTKEEQRVMDEKCKNVLERVEQ